jgi:His-Xaa-Ser system protein HxsD
VVSPYEVRFSSYTYNLETIKRAAYRFTGQLAFNFIPEKDSIACEITPLSLNEPSEIELAISEFKNEVLDQDLRRTIAEETATVRNVILAHVFSKTGLQSVE